MLGDDHLSSETDDQVIAVYKSEIDRINAEVVARGGPDRFFDYMLECPSGVDDEIMNKYDDLWDLVGDTMHLCECLMNDGEEDGLKVDSVFVYLLREEAVHKGRNHWN